MSNGPTPMNINSGNHLIPRNMMNVNTIRESMLGKRKGGQSGYERANKRRDLSMIADVGRISSDKVNIRLPIQIVEELKRVNELSSAQRYEYAGKIDFKVGNGEVKFNTPNRYTSYERNRISSEIVGMIRNYYITYHTHPAATSKINNNTNGNRMNINNNSRTRYFTLPSGMDFEAYVKAYPGMQANIIADAYGYYVIDVIEAVERKTLPNPKMINQVMEWIRSLNFLKTRYRNVDGYEYFESTLKEWRAAINNDLDPFMIKHFGVSVRYYGYNHPRALITLKRK